MLTNKAIVVLLLNIYFVSCAPADSTNYLPPSSANDQITQDSNLSGVSVILQI